MSQLVSATQDESVGLWLPLMEFSIKSGVSLSTIRRKIKSNSIPFKLEKGKYFILYTGPATATAVVNPVPRPQPAAVSPTPSWDGLADALQITENRPAPKPTPSLRSQSTSDEAMQRMTTAFELALKEKENQVRLLERRNADLEERLKEMKLLVEVIEQKYRVRY